MLTLAIVTFALLIAAIVAPLVVASEAPPKPRRTIHHSHPRYRYFH